MNALYNTLVVAVFSSVLATVLGTLAAVGIFGMRKSVRTAVMNVTYLPVLNPDILTAISMMLVFSLMRIPFGLVTLIIAHTTFNIPYVILSVMPKLRQFNISTYEAALDLGARRPSRCARSCCLRSCRGYHGDAAFLYPVDRRLYYKLFYKGHRGADPAHRHLFHDAAQGHAQGQRFVHALFVVVLAR